MRRALLIAFCLVFLLITSFSSAASTGQPVEDLTAEPSPGTGWWDHWNRDVNHNNIDDVLDDMMAFTPETYRTRVFIDYYRHPTDEDVARLSNLDLEVKYIYKYIDTICARNVMLSDIEDISNLPGVVMVEYEDEVSGNLDISAKSVKAKASEEYSPETTDDLNILGRSVSIAILDSGVDDGPLPAPPPYHNALDDLDDDVTTDDPKFLAGVDTTHIIYVTDGSYNPDDSFIPGHGTHVAGTAMGTDAGSDYRGVAPQARLVDVKVMERWGSGVMGEIVLGIEWCIDHKDDDFDDDGEPDGIDILSMSIGGNYNSDGSDAASQAVNAAADAGLISVVAAGNGGSNIIGPPASADSAIVVGAIDDQSTVDRSDDQVWSSSNIGPRQDDGDEDHLDELKPDILAPGVNVMSAKSGSPGAYISYSGTSMACPHVAGVIALMLEANPDLTPDRVKEILHETAEMPPGVDPSTEYDDTYNYAWGWGMVDAYEAVRLAQQEDDDPPVISDIEVVDVSATTATMTWLTNKPSNTIVQYGETTGLGMGESDLDNYVVSHSMTLEDLNSDTDYYFNIQGSDEYGNGPGESGIQGPFHTDILPDLIPPEIIDGPVVLGIPGDTSATIYWRTDEISDSVIEYGLEQNYGESESDPIDVIEHYITLTGLTPATTYHYRAQSNDPSGNQKNSTDFTFITATEPDTTPPLITSGPDVINTTYNNATIKWQTDEASTTLVRYGETPSYGKEVGNSAFVLVHQIKLTGLSSSTTYYYQVESKDSSGNIRKFNDESTHFTTGGPPDTMPPIITDGPEAISVTDSEATIRWVTDEKSDSLVQYGLTKSYGQKEPKIPKEEYILVHQITLTDLWPSTTYHYRVVSEDQSGNYVESDDHTFTTASPPDVDSPEILYGPNLLVVGEHTATITWTTDEASDSILYYGPTSSYGSTASGPSQVMEHEVILTGLSSSTTYHYKVRSSDESGNYVESDDNIFTTLQISIPIEIEFFDFIDGQVIKEVTVIECRVSGGTGLVEWARFKVDNGSWENLGEGPTFEIRIDPKDYPSGDHTLYVEISDGKTSMQEDITFTVEHPTEETEEIWLWILFAVIAATIILVLAVVAYNSRAKRKPSQAAFSDLNLEPAPVFSPVSFTPDGPEGIGFIPDEPAEVSFIPNAAEMDDEPGISFIPETTTLSEEPGISFIPDREPISFNILEDEEETVFPVLDKVRCPRCKSMFEADISSNIVCPDCGFRAGLKR